MLRTTCLDRQVPAREAFAWLTSWVWVFGLGLIVFLDLLFPNGRLPSARWRWFARLTAIVLLPAAILAALSPGLILETRDDSEGQQAD